MLTIAGFDPSSGAGVTADLQVFAAHGLFGTACITALTVQSTRGVKRTVPLEAPLVEETLHCLTDDLPPVGIKVGMLGNAALVRTVSAALRSLRQQQNFVLVLDPVLRSSSGHAMLDREGVEALVAELLPMVDCATPNRAELRILLGSVPTAVPEQSAGAEPRENLILLAHELQQKSGCRGLVITGGDAERPEDLVLAPAQAPVWLRGEHIETTSTHGTGCAFSSALLARLVQGRELLTAASDAKRYVEGALGSAPGLGHGRGPLNLRWRDQSADE